MRSAAAIVLILSSAAALAHPGHGKSAVHTHGFSPELTLLAVLVVAWALLRSR